MKYSLRIIIACCFFSCAVNAQTTQKLSLGLLGGFNSPTQVSVHGKQPDSFKSNRTTAFSKGIFLQYELPHNLFVRGTFKKGTINLENRYQRYDAGMLISEKNYGSGFDNKQFELSLAYRKNIKNSLFFTGSLGATYLDFKNLGSPDLIASMSNDPGMTYWVKHAPNTLKEKSVLLNAALGLEYKTKRKNVFMLELAYYKGFSTVGSYNFTMDDYLSQTPKVLHYEASLKTRGDYAELRLGYRMPLQKFVNLYTAIKNPKPKQTLKPDSINQQDFSGIYLGLETGKQIFYSNQEQEWPDHTIKLKNSTWNSCLSFYTGYQFKNGLILESGLRFGNASIYASGVDIFGIAGHWSFSMVTNPVSVKYAVPLLGHKIYLTPEAGLWQSFTQTEGTNSFDSWGAMGEFHNIENHIKSLERDYNIGYHWGLNLNGRFGRNFELGIGYRFSDNFSKNPVGFNIITYERNYVKQPAIVSTSRLQNSAVSISFRKFFRKK